MILSDLSGLLLNHRTKLWALQQIISKLSRDYHLLRRYFHLQNARNARPADFILFKQIRRPYLISGAGGNAIIIYFYACVFYTGPLKDADLKRLFFFKGESIKIMSLFHYATRFFNERRRQRSHGLLFYKIVCRMSLTAHTITQLLLQQMPMRQIETLTFYWL